VRSVPIEHARSSRSRLPTSQHDATALTPAIGAVLLAVGCSQDAADGTKADGGTAGASFAGAHNESGSSGASLAGARDEGGAPGTSFAGAPGDGGESGATFAGAPGEQTTPSKLSCLSVLQCTGACPDENADACVEDCLNQTSESSQPVPLASSSGATGRSHPWLRMW